MMKKILTLSCLTIALAILSNSITAQVNIKSQVKAEAKENVNSFLNLIPQGQEQEYGFNSREDFKKVTIGESYQVYFVERKNGEVNLLATNTFRVPVLVNGKSVALLTVKRNKNGETKIVDFGATKLAKELEAFENSFQSKNERVLVRNTFLKQDFIVPQLSNFSNRSANGDIAIKANSKALLYPIGKVKQSALKPNAFISATINAEAL